MTRLLVSVRSAEEALIAVENGAAVIDVKDPSKGSLGRAEYSVWRDVLNSLNKFEVPVSVALGELASLPAVNPSQFMGIRYAKTGMSGMGCHANWQLQWKTSIDPLPTEVSRVAVAYADPTAEAPPPEDVLAAAASLACPMLLIDTFDKSNGGLLHYMDKSRLARFVQRIHAAGIKVALAGSLRESDIETVLDLGPEIIAVRGAVCEGGRIGSISAAKTARLAKLIETCRN